MQQQREGAMYCSPAYRGCAYVALMYACLSIPLWILTRLEIELIKELRRPIGKPHCEWYRIYRP